MKALTCVVIPSNEACALETQHFEYADGANVDALLEEFAYTLMGDSIKLSPLFLPSGDTPGLYAFGCVGNSFSTNIRATRLAMACGSLALRFLGDVLLFRSKGGHGWLNLDVDDLYGACCISPDLRDSIQQSLGSSHVIPDWLADAAQRNYHDHATIARLASVMNPCSSEDATSDEEIDSTLGKEHDFPSNKSEDSFQSQGSKLSNHDAPSEQLMCNEVGFSFSNEPVETTMQFVARSSLCLYCRRPSISPCPDCKGAYFCQEPRNCRQLGWSHSCLCRTWNLYTERRTELSIFPFEEWSLKLVGRDCQLSEEPYRKFLTDVLGLSLDISSWWRTELDGWQGGESISAMTVDLSQRRSYADGFAPVDAIPPEQRLSPQDLDKVDGITRNACNLLVLTSWDQYYRLRGLPLSSPASLLLTFPLTIYDAIVRHGEVPVTVARMLNRPLRVHVVGIEKEMNFLDIFKEIGFLLPEDLKVEMVFVVRKDMLPVSSRKQPHHGRSIKIELTSNLILLLASGTYGEDLDPHFDCGSGGPDMVIAMNAGLFAYESWRSVITFLYHHHGVVGVFTDYNEHSGMNCASLGGGKSRDSLYVNPFRQPRAMPVYSMNLPQFSNGFVYVYNAQTLD